MVYIMVFEETILQSPDFKRRYDLYRKQFNAEKLREFLDNIDTNKKYYRMSIHKNKRYAKVVTEDTNKIKQMTSFINRLTDMNYSLLSDKIIEHLQEDYLVPYVVETLIEQSLTHRVYIHLYVRLLERIHLLKPKFQIYRTCYKYYEKIFLKNQEEQSSSYLTLCAKNKKTDQMIGFSLLISQLESQGVIHRFCDEVIGNYLKTLLEIDNKEEIYQMLLCFEQIAKLKYHDGLPETYHTLLIQLKEKNHSSKIKFKLMDILGE